MTSSELLAAIEQAAPGALLVLTANHRRALALAAHHDAHQLAAGRSSWPTAPIFEWSQWIDQCHERALHGLHGRDLPLVLSAAQEGALWQDQVRAAGVTVLSVAATAALAAEAWALAQRANLAGRLATRAFTPDAQAFAGWARQFRDRCTALGMLDRARLPDLVTRLIEDGLLPLPARVVLAGFATPDPQQRALLAALASAGVRIDALAPPTVAGARVARLACADVVAEDAALAAWCRARLTVHPQARIGIVLPDLTARRDATRRALDSALSPADPWRAADRAALVNVSLGDPLAEHPLIDAALAALEWTAGPLPFARASALVCGPWLAGAGPEAGARARCDARWRERAGASVSLEALRRQAVASGAVPQLAAAVTRVLALTARDLRGKHDAARWAEWLPQLLSAWGWPDGRPLDSHDHQAVERWNRLLGEFAALARVGPRMHLGQAVARLANLAADTLHQPQSAPAAPVQLLGVLEADGLQFDHLWVAGLTDAAWPPAARLHPLLPADLQREAGLVNTTPELALARARRLTAGWIQAAPEVVLSHAQRADDRPLRPSALVQALPACAPDWPAAPDPWALVAAGAALEPIADTDAPPLVLPADGVAVAGGTSVLLDQSACPFRAFALRRLHADVPADPVDGADAGTRGTLLHRVLARFWGRLAEPTHGAAVAAGRTGRLQHLHDVAAAVVAEQLLRQPDLFGPRGAQLEAGRLAARAAEWLDYELALPQRAGARVVGVEQDQTLTIGPLSLAGRYDRLDVDADGAHVLIDYKTGATVSAAAWQGNRPDDPQLPMYAVAGVADVRALAFARVRPGHCELRGWAAEDERLPGKPLGWQGAASDWPAVLAGWRGVLTRLAADYADGRAAVDPRPSPSGAIEGTCRHCDQRALCRIDARAVAAGHDLALEAEAAGDSDAA